jgi:hypothetical protein
MSDSEKCNGYGYCILQCVCSCYDDEESEIPSENCICGHREHPKLIGGDTCFNVYCKEECRFNCQLIECYNFRICKQKTPQWLLYAHNGMCTYCAINLGKIRFLETKDDCPICMENKDMIEISCEKHKVCLDCWKQLSESQTCIPMKCPLCRESIWKSKQ